MISDRIDEAKSLTIAEVAGRLSIAGLKRAGSEMVGPCPVCGGRDRFSIAPRRGLFHCRRCGTGGDGIALVRHVLGCDLKAALDWLLGPPRELTAEEKAERQKAKEKAEAEAQRKAAEEARFRRRAQEAAHRIWRAALPAENSPVRAYLERRGITRAALPDLPACLRFHPALPYHADREGGRTEVIHTGPAMLAAVQGPDRRFIGLHRTWLDLDQPKGKARIIHPATGEPLPAKKMAGSHMGGAIRLTPPAPVLVMGEGIETTLSALAGWTAGGPAFWAAGSLGNMAGRMQPADLRRDGTRPRWSGVPDLDGGPAFVPPEGCRRLIYVEDGDSDPAMTRAKVLCGLRRAMVLRPGLRAQFVSAPKGCDLNDVLMGEAEDA